MTEQEYDLSEGCCTPETLNVCWCAMEATPEGVGLSVTHYVCVHCGVPWWLVGDTYYQDPKDAIGRSES